MFVSFYICFFAAPTPPEKMILSSAGSPIKESPGSGLQYFSQISYTRASKPIFDELHLSCEIVDGTNSNFTSDCTETVVSNPDVDSPVYKVNAL